MTGLLVPDASPTRARGFFRPEGRLWRNANFMALWGAQILSQLGLRIQMVAILWWVVAASTGTGRLGPAGTVMAIVTVPQVLVPPFAGKVADRMDRRVLMFGAILCQAGLGFALAACAFVAGGRSPTFAILLPLIAVGAIAGSVFNPVAMAAVPALVEEADLFQANSLQELTLQGAGLVGPPLGGALVAFWGAPWAFMLAAASMGLAALVMTRMSGTASTAGTVDAPGDAPEGSWSLRQDVPLLAMMGIIAAMNFFTVPLLIFFPYLSSTVFHTGAMGFGSLEGAVSLGMVASALVLSRRPEGFSRPDRMIAGSLLGIGIACLLLGGLPRFVPALGEAAIIGGLVSLVSVTVISATQRRVPPEAMGQVMGWLFALTSAAMPLSFWLYGPLADQLTPMPLLMANGTAIVAIALLLTLTPGIRMLAATRSG